MAHWKVIVDVMLGPIGLLLTNFGKVKQIIQDIINVLGGIGRAVSDALGWLGKIPGGSARVQGSERFLGLSAPGGADGPVATPVMMITVYATPGDHLPEVVYGALKGYQRRHARPEEAALPVRLS